MQEKIVIHICKNMHKQSGCSPTPLEQLYFALLFLKEQKISLEQVCIEERPLSISRKEY